MKPKRQDVLLPEITTLLFAQFYAQQQLSDVIEVTI